MNLASRLLSGEANSVAVSDDEGALTYQELAERSALVRGGFLAEGIGPGDRVGLALGNTTEFAVAYIAILGLGAVAVPLNPESPAPEMAEHLRRSNVTRALLDAGDLPSAAPLPVTDVGASAVAVLCDTAGTAGPSRSAALTHGSLLAAIDQMGADARTSIIATDATLGVLPLFHIYGLNVILGRTLASGGEVRLRNTFDPSAPLEGITVIAGVPPMFDAWAAACAEVSLARMIVSGAAPLRAATAKRFEDATGRKIAQGYGLTEASPTVTSGLLLDDPDPMSVGVPLPGVAVRLVDETGTDVLEGDPGEIWVRGPNVFAGYDGEPELSARVLRGGWLHTGDVGVADEKGRLYIVDRTKDLIIVSGFNVYPGEVEEILLQSPAVAQAAVVGVDDDSTGEAVKAIVVPAHGEKPTAEEIVSWCRARLARYKCPHEVEFADSLPVLRTGKVLRRAL